MPSRSRLEELRVGAHVVELAGDVHGAEPGQRVLDRRGLGAVQGSARRHHACPRSYEVPPADPPLVEQPGDVSPHVRAWFALRRVPDLGAVGGVVPRELQVRDAAHRVVQIGAGGRPARHEEQVRGQGPRVGGREHAIVQRVSLRVRPVVRDLVRGVVSHHVRLTLWPGRRLRTRRHVGVVVAVVLDDPQGVDEAVHASAVDRQLRTVLGMRPTLIERVPVVVRRPAGPERIGLADVEGAVGTPGDPVGSRERPEVVVERAVLLHHEHEVIQVHDPRRRFERAVRIGDRLRRWRRLERGSIDSRGRPPGQDRVLVRHEERERHLAGRRGRDGGGLGRHRRGRGLQGRLRPPIQAAAVSVADSRSTVGRSRGLTRMRRSCYPQRITRRGTLSEAADRA